MKEACWFGCGKVERTAYAPPPMFSIGKLTEKLSDGVLKAKKEHSPKWLYS